MEGLWLVNGLFLIIPITRLGVFMKVSYNLMPPSFSEMRSVALASERAGLHSVAVADSPLISRELFVSCAEVLRETNYLTVMTGVTKPLTRHPSVAAAAIAALCEMAPGGWWWG